MGQVAPKQYLMYPSLQPLAASPALLLYVQCMHPQHATGENGWLGQARALEIRRPAKSLWICSFLITRFHAVPVE